MRKPVIILTTSILLILLFNSSCQQPIEFPDGVDVFIDGQTIEGEKTVTVSEGADVRLQVFGLQPLSTVSFKIRKFGVKVYENELEVNGDGQVDEMLSLPEFQAQVTAVISYTAYSGTKEEISFIIKVR